MAWTTPRTWVVGEIATAAQFNTHLRDNVSALGPASVGTTASAVATAVGAADGLQMNLRLGSTPYDFISLVYDATYGKWVSQPEWQTPASWTTLRELADITAVAEFSANDRVVFHNWGVCVTAGLTPQVRYAGWLGQTSGAAIATHFTLGFVGEALAAATAENAVTSLASTQLDVTGGTFVYRDTGWKDASGATTADRQVVSLMGWRDSGGTLKNAGAKHYRIGLRWVV